MGNSYICRLWMGFLGVFFFIIVKLILLLPSSIHHHSLHLKFLIYHSLFLNQTLHIYIYIAWNRARKYQMNLIISISIWLLLSGYKCHLVHRQTQEDLLQLYERRREIHICWEISTGLPSFALNKRQAVCDILLPKCSC